MHVQCMLATRLHAHCVMCIRFECNCLKLTYFNAAINMHNTGGIHNKVYYCQWSRSQICGLSNKIIYDKICQIISVCFSSISII